MSSIEDQLIPTAHTDKRFMSRKFRIACIVWALGSIAWIYGFASGTTTMDANQWIDFTKWIVGLYFTSNVAESFVTSRSTKLI